MKRGEASVPSSEETRAILRFRVMRVELALFADQVEEVTEPAEITPIPCAPPHVPGVVPVRGEALPLFDLALFLGLSGDGADGMPRMLIVRSAAYRVGVLCDHVLGVTAVAAAAIQEARVCGPPSLRRYALGEVELRGGVTPVLDLEALLAAGRAQ